MSDVWIYRKNKNLSDITFDWLSLFAPKRVTAKPMFICPSISKYTWHLQTWKAALKPNWAFSKSLLMSVSVHQDYTFHTFYHVLVSIKLKRLNIYGWPATFQVIGHDCFIFMKQNIIPKMYRCLSIWKLNSDILIFWQCTVKAGKNDMRFSCMTGQDETHSAVSLVTRCFVYTSKADIWLKLQN